jgi:hypothetical protein
MKFPDPTKDDKRCAVVREVKIDGMVTFDVSPRAYICIRGPPLISSPTISAIAPLRCAHMTFSKNPHPPRLKRTIFPAISALSCIDWISAWFALDSAGLGLLGPDALEPDKGLWR